MAVIGCEGTVLVRIIRETRRASWVESIRSINVPRPLALGMNERVVLLLVSESRLRLTDSMVLPGWVPVRLLSGAMIRASYTRAQTTKWYRWPPPGALASGVSDTTTLHPLEPLLRCARNLDDEPGEDECRISRRSNARNLGHRPAEMGASTEASRAEAKLRAPHEMDHGT